MNGTIRVYFLSYDVGIKLFNATTNVGILMNINVNDASAANVWAHTRTGNGTRTIVVGAHSDGVWMQEVKSIITVRKMSRD